MIASLPPASGSERYAAGALQQLSRALLLLGTFGIQALEVRARQLVVRGCDGWMDGLCGTPNLLLGSAGIVVTIGLAGRSPRSLSHKRKDMNVG